MTKSCCHCKQEKPLVEFTKDRRAKDGLQSRCKKCAYFWQARDYAARPEFYRYKRKQRVLKDPEGAAQYQRDYQLKYQYGITRQQVDEMLKTQDGKCRICALPMTKPNVDHCHETGEVRGLLCNNCNRGIGHLKNSIPNLKAAIAYLSPAEPLADKPKE